MKIVAKESKAHVLALMILAGGAVAGLAGIMSSGLALHLF
jgi:hypothetical protein